MGFIFAYKRFWTLDFEVLMVLRAAKADQGSPKTLPRRSQEAGARLLGGAWGALEVHKPPQATILDTFIGFRASKNPPGGPQVTI